MIDKGMNSNKLILTVFAVAAMLAVLPESKASAQKMSLSTNVMEYVNFMTFNAEASYAVSRHWSGAAAFRYNPFSFHFGGEDGKDMQNRQQTYSLGVRYWPWHVHSGWWLSGKAQYQEYNSGGIISLKTREGDRVGLAVAAGYSRMILKNLNLEFGAGLWGGGDKYKVYSCPVCGLTEESGSKFFVLPDDLILGFSYVF